MFTVKSDRDLTEHWHWVAKTFIHIALLCALAGIVQFFAQFVIHARWLFDYTNLIPKPIRGVGVWNTVIPIGSHFKSNGFFLREPSIFSQLMGIAILCELALYKRAHYIAAFTLGLILSYSGTGLGVLLIGLAFPLNRKAIIRILLLAASGVLIFLVLGEALDLSFIFNRIHEFTTPNTSGYDRFVAPFQLILDRFHSEPWSAYLGHGPGTARRVIVDNTRFFPATYMKLTYEYGLAGVLVFVSLFLHAINRFYLPINIRAGLFSCWLLMGGYLLAPAHTLETYILAAMWPSALLTKSHFNQPFV